jgi:hypothetical protein
LHSSGLTKTNDERRRVKKTNKQIADEIAELKRLRPLIPKLTMFGERNLDAIDAQIEALADEFDESDCYNLYDLNEWTQRELENALDAIQWRDGESDDQPSGKDGWGGLTKQ